MRIEFKKQEVKVSKFCKFCENNGADYFETDEDCGIWIKPEFSKDSNGEICRYRCALKLKKNGEVVFGDINESCVNFETNTSPTSKESQVWMIEILTLFKKYKP